MGIHQLCKHGGRSFQAVAGRMSAFGGGIGWMACIGAGDDIGQDNGAGSIHGYMICHRRLCWCFNMGMAG